MAEISKDNKKVLDYLEFLLDGGEPKNSRVGICTNIENETEICLSPYILKQFPGGIGADSYVIPCPSYLIDEVAKELKMQYEYYCGISDYSPSSLDLAGHMYAITLNMYDFNIPYNKVRKDLIEWLIVLIKEGTNVIWTKG